MGIFNIDGCTDNLSSTKWYSLFTKNALTPLGWSLCHFPHPAYVYYSYSYLQILSVLHFSCANLSSLMILIQKIFSRSVFNFHYHFQNRSTCKMPRWEKVRVINTKYDKYLSRFWVFLYSMPAHKMYFKKYNACRLNILKCIFYY